MGLLGAGGEIKHEVVPVRKFGVDARLLEKGAGALALVAEGHQDLGPVTVFEAPMSAFEARGRLFEGEIAGVFHRIFHARHDGIGGRGGAEAEHPFV